MQLYTTVKLLNSKCNIVGDLEEKEEDLSHLFPRKSLEECQTIEKRLKDTNFNMKFVSKF